FHEKLPQVYLAPTSYFLVFPENISAIGASFSTGVGDANVAGEVHLRRNNPLNSTALLLAPGSTADNHNNPLYAVGNTVHAQVSTIYQLPKTWLWPTAALSAEIGGVRRTSVSKNEAALDPTRDRTAWGFVVRLAPTYFSVRPNLDVDVPLTLSYNPKGKSPVAAFSGDKTGAFSLGATATYQKVWI